MTICESTGAVYGGPFIAWIGIAASKELLFATLANCYRILCVKSGNPLTIADQDIGVLPPSQLVCHILFGFVHYLFVLY